jgi:tripartite-type tricarboxylate transporter receptor subunit TctC
MQAITRWMAAAGAALTLTAGAAGAAPYPNQAVTVVVPQAPGGTNDIVARLIAAELTASLHQSFIVTNRPGAGGNIGTEAARRTAPDGYTLLATISSTQAINPALYKQPGFDPVKDFTPLAMLGVVPNVLLVNPSFPAQDLASFISLVKANPGKYQYASAGNGSLNHLLGAMLDQMAGLKMQHIPYRGVAPAMADVLGNQVPIVFASLPSAMPFIRDGKLRAIGVSSQKRSPALPDVPAIGEQVPGYAGDLWIALFAVAGTPEDAQQTIVDAVRRTLAKPEIQKKLADLGVEPLPDTQAQLGQRLADDMVKWRAIVEASGARVD